MKVELIDHMGSDLSVVNAARVSFNKKSALLRGNTGWFITPKDNKLIKYLAKHNHFSPFTHNAVTLHIKAPIFVARQLQKHQVGFAWNEVSRRYVSDEPEFYVPDVWRRAADNVKQGSSDEDAQVNDEWINSINKISLLDYEALLEDGVCPEQARMVLPQSMYTEWMWTGNLLGFSRVYNLRTDSHTQRETQDIANQIGEVLGKLFPVSWKELTNGTEAAD
jgi:thymidylate synthase (FAD)